MTKVPLLLLWLAGACIARYDALSISGEWTIGAYKAILSPLQGSNVCNFSPTCSQFARGAIRSQGFLPGLLIGADRLMRCNTVAWSYYENYYTGDVINGRMPDPVANHVAWLKPPDEPGLLVSARTSASSESTGADRTLAAPSVSFADYLYRSGEYPQAAGEYLRIRFVSGPPRLQEYAGLMAGESYLRAGDLAAARHAFRDLDTPPLQDFTRYAVARTYFAAADYAGTRSVLNSLTSNVLSRQAGTLVGWSYFRQRRFAQGSAAMGVVGTDNPSRHLSTMDGRDIRRRSRFASTLLSAIIPGAGQAYSGRAGDGAYSFLTVAGTGLVTWWFAAGPATRDRTRVKISIFGIVTVLFYAGNVYGANIAARDYNLLQERRYVQRADSLFELLSIEPDYHDLLDSVTVDTAPTSRE